jgi:hypothetical protein
MSQPIQLSSSATDDSPPPVSPRCNWRLLMEDPPTDELFGWIVLVLLAFAPPLGWVLASLLREVFA